MLYVFLMQTGTLKTYDMNLALETVENLKLAIQRDYSIPKDKQVLLISGGDVLQEAKPVSYYHAGTDTNPIFVFSMADIEADRPYIREGNRMSNAMLFANDIENASKLPPTFEALKLRTSLARNMYKVAENSLANSENMNYTQHLQQQGWAAVIANLEDMVSGISKRSKSFELFFKKQLDLRNHYIQLLQSFTDDLQKLSKIPLLESLLDGASKCGPDVTLLKWIINDDTRNNLELMATKCVQILDEMTSTNLETIVSDTNIHVKHIEESKLMKEVGGLPERLFCMDKLLTNLRNEVAYQGKLAQNMADHEKQILSMKDTDILLDLSHNHQDILKKMHICHTHIEDMEGRFSDSKGEVSENLHSRLRWIMMAEKRLNDKDSFLIIQYERLRWFKNHMHIIKQIHKSPQIYFSALVEIVRRKRFSESFTQWAGQVVKNSVDLHKEEVKRRIEFNHLIQNHFLKDLFPGIGDMPPCFASEEPRPFDQDLPNVLPEDIENIKKIVPEFNMFINQVSIDSALGHDDLSLIFKEGPNKIPKLDTFTESTCGLDSKAKLKEEMSKFYDAQEFDIQIPSFGNQVKRKSITSPNLEHPETSVASAPELHLDTCSSLDFETANFYNDEIMPSITDATVEVAQEATPHNCQEEQLEGLLEEKKASLKVLQDKVNDYEHNFRGLMSNIREIDEIKEEIKNLQHNCSSKTLEELTALKVRLPALIADVQDKFQSETEELKLRLMLEKRDELEKQRQDTTCQMDHLLRINKEQEEKIACLSFELENSQIASQQQLAQLQVQLDEVRQKSYLDFEPIHLEKGQPESIENIDRYSFSNPQEKSLMQEFLAWKKLKQEKDKFTYGDMVESIQEQYRMEISNYKAQQESEMEESFFKLKRQKDQEVSTLHANLEDKSKQLSLFKENLSQYYTLNIELSQSLRDQQMSMEGPLQDVCSSSVSTTNFGRDPVLGEGKKLQQFMQQLEDQKVEIVCLRQKLSIKDGNHVTLLTCDPGDIVLVYYEEKNNSYLILNERPELFFIHTDCYEEMGLRKVTEPGVPQKYWTLAEVEAKEYCQAKKPNNRFKLPVQTRFYRVRIKPHFLKKYRKSAAGDKPTTNKQELVPPTKTTASTFEKRNQ